MPQYILPHTLLINQIKNKMLQISNLSFKYIKEQIFSEINLLVHTNEIISVIGKSGSGKTTLLNLMSGLIKPKNGLITLGETTHLPTRKICYLKQKPTLLFYRTVLENVLLNLEIRNQINESNIAKARTLLTDYDLHQAINKYPHELSEGMKSRVCIIQTLLTQAELFLLDEPFASIDRNNAELIEEDIWKLIRENSSSAIIVTHDLEQALSISDRIIILPSNKSEEIETISVTDSLRILNPAKRRGGREFSMELLNLIQKFSLK